LYALACCLSHYQGFCISSKLITGTSSIASVASQSYLRSVFSSKAVRLASFLGGLFFAIFYAFAVGMAYQSPTPLPEYIETPAADLVASPTILGSGVILYLNRSWVIYLSVEPVLVTSILSLLFSLNLAMLTYRLKVLGRRCEAREYFSILSILPSIFASYSCCVAGFIPLILGGVGSGIGLLALLRPFTYLAVTVSAFLLSANIFFTIRRVR